MMHNDQIHIDAPLVTHLINKQFPQYRSLEVKKLDTQGTVNAIYRLGHELVAKFPLRLIDATLCHEQM